MRLVLLLLGSATGLVPLSHLRPVARSRGSALSLHADCGDLVSTLTAAAADAAALKPQINELKDIAAPDLTDALSGFSNDALVYLASLTLLLVIIQSGAADLLDGIGMLVMYACYLVMMAFAPSVRQWYRVSICGMAICALR